MRKRYKALEQTFEEHLATHEALIDTHEKLKEAHSSLHAQKKELIEIASVGVTCDILDESFYAPIVVAPTNPSCSTTTSTSPLSDGFTCDASLMVENETLKKEVNELTHTLAKVYGLCAWVAKELLSTKRDWAIPPRKARRPLLLTRLVL